MGLNFFFLKRGWLSCKIWKNRGRMTDRNRELVPNSCNLVRESADHWTFCGWVVFWTLRCLQKSGAAGKECTQNAWTPKCVTCSVSPQYQVTTVQQSQDGLSSGWSSSAISYQGGPWVSPGWSPIKVASHQGGLSSGWSLIRVVSSGWSHQGGLSSGWSHQKALSSRWSFIRVVSHHLLSSWVASHQEGLSSGWSLIRVVSSGWSLIRVVSHQSGLSSGWSHQGGLSERSLIGVVSSGLSIIRAVSHQGGLSSGWSLITFSPHGCSFIKGSIALILLLFRLWMLPQLPLFGRADGWHVLLSFKIYNMCYRVLWCS